MAATGPFARRFLSAAVRAGAFGAAMAFIVSCQSEAPTETRLARDVSLAKGGGGGGGGGTGGSGVAPTVSSPSPSFAFQDTTIDVTIVGSDFTNGASAAWSLNGNTSYVQVKSTKFLSATELKVSLVVPASAPAACSSRHCTTYSAHRSSRSSRLPSGRRWAPFCWFRSRRPPNRCFARRRRGWL